MHLRGETGLCGKATCSELRQDRFRTSKNVNGPTYIEQRARALPGTQGSRRSWARNEVMGHPRRDLRAGDGRVGRLGQQLPLMLK